MGTARHRPALPMGAQMRAVSARTGRVFATAGVDSGARSLYFCAGTPVETDRDRPVARPRAPVAAVAPRSGTADEKGTHVDERALATQFRAGDPGAIREVYERFAGPVTTVGTSLLGDPELAAEVVQRTFVQAWRAADTFDPERPLAPWLYAIARRVAIDVWREESRRAQPTTLGTEAEADVAATPDTFEHAWEAWEVRLALHDLPADEREVVRLTHYEGLTHAEVAARVGVPIGTVKSRSHRAHRRLAARLQHLLEVTG